MGVWGFGDFGAWDRGCLGLLGSWLGLGLGLCFCVVLWPLSRAKGVIENPKCNYPQIVN